MDESRFASILLTVVEALEHPPSERLTFLRTRCGDDEELFTRASLLLPSTEGSPTAESRDARGTSPFDLSLSAIERLAASISPGEHFPDRIGAYSLVRRLGRGGMGDVFLADVAGAERERSPVTAPTGADATVTAPDRVALKLLRPGTYSDDGFARFHREAEILARLDHPGIARVYDSGTADVEGRTYPYLALEYVDGSTLREFLRDRDPSAEECVRLLRDICRAVEHAHAAGVVHRDLKPENIMIDRAGRPRILDFGVARLRREERQAGNRTETSAVLGTPAYMSPEQLRREHDRVDSRSDVFALGVIGYEMLARRHPFLVGRGMAAIQAADVLAREPQPLAHHDPALHRDLDAILARAMEKHAADRFANAGEMANDLERRIASRTLSASTRSPRRRARRWARLHPAASRSLLVSTALVLIAAIVLLARMSAGPSSDTVYAKASSDINEADRLIFTDEDSEEDQRAAVALLERAREAIARVPARPYTPHLNAYIYRRFGEAMIHVGSAKRNAADLRAARVYLQQALAFAWEPEGLKSLPADSPLLEKLQKNTRHAPSLLLGLVASYLSELDYPQGEVNQSLIAGKSALELWETLGPRDYGSPDVGYSVTGLDKALLLQGVGDAIRRWGWVLQISDVHDQCFPYFAQADTVHALAWWPDTHAPFLKKYSLAYLERAEMSGNAADLDTARTILARYFQIKTKANGGVSYAGGMSTRARTWLAQSRLAGSTATRRELLDRAQTDAGEALGVVSPDRDPIGWAKVEMQAAEISDDLALLTRDRAAMVAAETSYAEAARVVDAASHPVLHCDLLAGRARHERIRWQITGDDSARRGALRDIEDAAAVFSESQYPWLHARLEAEKKHLAGGASRDQTAR